MIYLRRSKRPDTGKKAAVAAVALVVVVFAVGYLFPSFYPRLLYPISSVLWGSESAAAGWFVGMAEIVQSKYALVEENKALREEVAARDRSMLILESLRAENDSLKGELGRTTKTNDLLGTILVRPPVSPYDTIIVDVGAADGVSVGDKAYAAGDVILGDVAETYPHESKVVLYSSPGRTTSVLVGTSTIAAEAVGKGGGNFSLKLPADIQLASGALVALPNIRQHSLGIVESVTPDPTDSLATVLFRSPVNVSQLRSVLISIK